MLSKEILEQINSYVGKNLRYRPPKKIRTPATEIEIEKCRKIVCCKILALPEEQLEKKLAAVNKETFAEYLLRYMNERGANLVEVYRRVNLDRRIFSKLRTNRYYKPHKRTIFIIAFGLKLNLAETEDLLDRAGYSFSNYDKADVIAKFFFEQNIHDLFTVNEALDHYGCRPLNG